MTSSSYRDIFDKLYSMYGPRHWWPGDTAFEVMVGAVLTQNTAWTNVERAVANLKRAELLSPWTIVNTPPKRLASIIRPSGYFNVKAKRLRALCWWIVEWGGLNRITRMPTDELRMALLTVHGVGAETADDILLYAFHRPVFVIDAYTRRVFKRLGFIEGKESYEILRRNFEDALGKDVLLYNEYHALIVRHGKDICRRKPLCRACCLAKVCPSSETTRKHRHQS